MNIKKQLLDKSRALEIGRGTGNPKKYIAVHQTGNTDKGADAQAHANLQSNKVLSYGWHWQVDDKIAIQSFDHDFKIWCQGDGWNGIGNNQAISVEICVNSDGNYNQTIENGAKLVARIMKQENIGIDFVKQHNFFSGKNCPEQIRAGKNGITWSKFIDKVKMNLGTEAPKPVIAETDSVDPEANFTISAGIFSNKIRAKEAINILEKAGFGYFDIVETKDVASKENPEHGFVGNFKVTAKNQLAIRKRPTTKSDKIGALNSGAVVSIAWIEGAWAKLKYQDGYVGVKYLTKL